MKSVSGVMVSSITDVRYIQFLRTRIEAGAESVGRNAGEVELGCVPGTIVSKDEGKALTLAREASAIYLPYLDPMTKFMGISEDEIVSVREALSSHDLKLAASLVSDKSVNSFKLWGTPNQMIEKISKLLDSGKGVDRINFGFGRGPEDLEGIELLGRKVLPYFQDSDEFCPP